MSDEVETKSKSPSHIAYTVTNTKDGDAYFNKVGAVWKHKDSKGFDLQVMEGVAVSGRVTMREMRDTHVQQQEDLEAVSEDRARTRSHDRER